jgi:uncharacterized protein (TIGR03545 family)
MSKETPLKKKKKGPIRYEAIIPITIVFLLFFAYFKFFFDIHLKAGMEMGGTYANGAEVNIGSLSTSFFNASLDIRDIQVTNKETPTQNVLQIGTIQFKALWDALLRGKVVIPLAAVTDIMINTARKRPGRVLPVKKSSEDNVQSMKSSALDVTNKVLEGSIFGDLAAIAQGDNYKEKLKEMEGNLKTSQFIQKMETELQAKEKLWKERIEKLPQKDELKKLEDRVKALKVDGKDPKAILAAVKEAEAIYKEVDEKYKTIKNTSGELSGDLKIYKNLYGDIKKYVDEDLKDLEGKLGIPSLDPKDIAMRIFGRQFAKEIYRAEKYMRLAREYMPPPKKDRQKPSITPRERQTGKNFKFRITKGYPKLWIQKATVSSKASAEGFSGSIGGEILHISDAPSSIAQPMEAKLTGEFPKSQMYDVMIHAVVDHRTENAKEYGTVKIGAFPLKDMMLSQSSDVTFGFQQATGSSVLKVELLDEGVSLNFDATFDKIAYLIEAKSSKAKEILTNISSNLGALTLNGSASGTWSNLNLDLNSNIGTKLQEALKQELNKQVAELKEKLRNEVNKKIEGEKEKLMGKVGDFEKKYGVSLKNQEDAMNSLKGKLEEEKKKAKDKGKDEIKDKAKELLKNKFKF